MYPESVLDKLLRLTRGGSNDFSISYKCIVIEKQDRESHYIPMMASVFALHLTFRSLAQGSYLHTEESPVSFLRSGAFGCICRI